MSTETPTNLALPLVSLYLAESKKQAVLALQGLSFIKKSDTLKSVIDLINAEIDMLIMQGANDIAIVKMSQVVMLEDVEMLIERTAKGISV